MRVTGNINISPSFLSLLSFLFIFPSPPAGHYHPSNRKRRFEPTERQTRDVGAVVSANFGDTRVDQMWETRSFMLQLLDIVLLSKGNMLFGKFEQNFRGTLQDKQLFDRGDRRSE